MEQNTAPQMTESPYWKATQRYLSYSSRPGARFALYLSALSSSTRKAATPPRFPGAASIATDSAR